MCCCYTYAVAVIIDDGTDRAVCTDGVNPMMMMMMMMRTVCGAGVVVVDIDIVYLRIAGSWPWWILASCWIAALSVVAVGCSSDILRSCCCCCYCLMATP